MNIMKLTKVFWCLCLLKGCLAHPASDRCREPDNLQAILSDYVTGDYLANILPPPIKKKLDRINSLTGSTTSASNNDKSQLLRDQIVYGNKTCPSTLPSGIYSDIEDRSLCPYYYTISNDPTRYPIAMVEARCRCQECIDGAGDQVCEPIYFQRNILRQTGCVNGVYSYVKDVYHVQNGCVCAKMRVAISQSSDQSPGQTATTTELPFTLS